MSYVENRLEKIGLSMLDESKLKKGSGNAAYIIHDDLLIIGGLEPAGDDGKPAFTGRLGREVTTEEGRKAARLVGLNMLRVMNDALGNLDRVDYFIRCTCLLNCAPGFLEQSEVADGFTDVMTEMFGERGMMARSDFGATNLNNNVPVICDAIIKLR